MGDYYGEGPDQMRTRGPRPPPRYKYPHEGDGRGDSESMRLQAWLSAALNLMLILMVFIALALSIWAVALASSNRRQINELDDDDGGGLLMRSNGERAGDPEDGHVLRWDRKEGSWVSGRPRLSDMEDVNLGGSKRTPLEDGDLLQWHDGQVVNVRDRILEQELGHHLDTRFGRLANGHIIIRNESSGQWQNVPLASLLALTSLKDVAIRRGSKIPDGSRLEYRQEEGRWHFQPPRSRAFLRFCVDPNTPEESWGHLDPALVPGRWTRVRPISPSAGIYSLDMFSRGGMQVSRKDVSISTPPRPKDGDGRPALAKPYRLQAVVSGRNFPPGAWGFLVGPESTPGDGGFMNDDDGDDDAESSRIRHWSIESVRDVPAGREIRLAYRAITAAPPQDKDGMTSAAPRPLIQCMHFSVEEL